MFKDDLLLGKRILVTGGGSGLGAAMARRFLELGAEVFICGRRVDVLSATAAELREATGGQVAAIPCDVRIADAVEEMMDRIADTGPLSVLVNNAAGNFLAQTHTLSHRAVNAVLGPTLHGAIHCTLAAGRRWIERGDKGVVLSILSTSTRTGRAFTVPSAIAKSGGLALIRSLAVEWGPRGIRTVGIAPGPFPTPGAWERLQPSERQADSSIEARNPLGRVGRTSELVNLAAYVVSDQAEYINGEMIAIDGGQHLRTSGVEDLLTWSDERWDKLGRKA